MRLSLHIKHTFYRPYFPMLCIIIGSKFIERVTSFENLTVKGVVHVFNVNVCSCSWCSCVEVFVITGVYFMVVFAVSQIIDVIPAVSVIAARKIYWHFSFSFLRHSFVSAILTVSFLLSPFRRMVKDDSFEKGFATEHVGCFAFFLV